MNRNVLAVMLAVACAIGAPAAAGATVYTINVPVQLSKVAVPVGTIFTVPCFLWSAKAPGEGTNVGAGQGGTKPLDATGASSGTVTVTVTTSQPALSYTCSLGIGELPGGGTVQASTLFGNFSSMGVGGTF